MPDHKPQLRTPEVRSFHRDPALPGATQTSSELTPPPVGTSTTAGPQGPAVSSLPCILCGDSADGKPGQKCGPCRAHVLKIYGLPA